ncbi:hypothetical protein C7B61_17010 [filamentous cyanobacterium CCP1]|nr:hypothetical protein C7B76_03680 [filamentous cyanobacterium CCP2]PSB60725.1 hypothetical protein C7B61_17010 [filamentous cyanobacterium CCP1]
MKQAGELSLGQAACPLFKIHEFSVIIHFVKLKPFASKHLVDRFVRLCFVKQAFECRSVLRPRLIKLIFGIIWDQR